MPKPKVRNYQQRKRKDTPTTVDVLLCCLEEGMTRVGAAAIAGVAERTFYDWMRDNPEFSQAVERAEAEFEQDMVRGIKREPKGKAWLLERRLRAGWAPPKLEIDASQKVEHTLVFTAKEVTDAGADNNQ
jgi:hypothetical protein